MVCECKGVCLRFKMKQRTKGSSAYSGLQRYCSVCVRTVIMNPDDLIFCPCCRGRVRSKSRKCGSRKSLFQENETKYNMSFELVT